MFGLRSISQPLYVVSTLSLALVIACGGPPEADILRRYFRASRAGDNATLSNIATASWDGGVVQDFTVTSVSEEQRRALQGKELLKALQDAEATEGTFNEEMRAYQEENGEALKRILGAERAEEEVASGDEEIAQAWTDWRAQMAEHATTTSEAAQQLNAERAAAEPSVSSESNPIDIAEHDGELLTKEVVLDATVEADGASTQKTLSVTLNRTELSGQSPGRWIITGIRES